MEDPSDVITWFCGLELMLCVFALLPQVTSIRARERPMSPTRRNLVEATQAFCDAFARKADIPTILTHFSKIKTISAFEYGDRALAPFLGRSFEGEEGVKKYFEIIGSLLAYDSLKYSELIVDVEERKVGVKGQGRFTWLETRESWDETFAYVLDFDEDAKVVRYQIWADSGAAYLARIGNLREVQKVGKHLL